MTAGSVPGLYFRICADEAQYLLKLIFLLVEVENTIGTIKSVKLNDNDVSSENQGVIRNDIPVHKLVPILTTMSGLVTVVPRGCK